MQLHLFKKKKKKNTTKIKFILLILDSQAIVDSSDTGLGWSCLLPAEYLYLHSHPQQQMCSNTYRHAAAFLQFEFDSIQHRSYMQKQSLSLAQELYAESVPFSCLLSIGSTFLGAGDFEGAQLKYITLLTFIIYLTRKKKQRERVHQSYVMHLNWIKVSSQSSASNETETGCCILPWYKTRLWLYLKKILS